MEKNTTNTKSVKISKFSKKKPIKTIKRTIPNDDYRKIPKDKLTRALQVIKNPEDPIWLDKNHNCAAAIHHCVENHELAGYSNAEIYKIKQARIFLMRRDWLNLAKVLSLLNLGGSRANTFIYPLCVKYATLCLAHKDKTLFDSFLHSIGVNDVGADIVKLCTSLQESAKAKPKLC